MKESSPRNGCDLNGVSEASWLFWRIGDVGSKRSPVPVLTLPLRRFPADDDADVGDTSGNYFFNAIPENGFVGNRYQLLARCSDRAQTGALPPERISAICIYAFRQHLPECLSPGRGISE